MVNARASTPASTGQRTSDSFNCVVLRIRWFIGVLVLGTFVFGSAVECTVEGLAAPQPVTQHAELSMLNHACAAVLGGQSLRRHSVGLLCAF